MTPAVPTPETKPRKVMNEVDGIMYLLFAGMFIFAGLLIWVEYKFPNDGQMFQVIAGLLTGFSGAFFGRIPTNKNIPPGHASAVTHTQTTEVKEQ